MLSDIIALLGIITPLAVLFSVVYSIRLMKKTEGQLKGVTSKVFGFLGAKGIDKEKIMQIESLAMEDLQEGMMKQFPELEIVLGMLSPDTLEKIKENPMALPILIQRYAPLIGMFKGKILQKKDGAANSPNKFDYG